MKPTRETAYEWVRDKLGCLDDAACAFAPEVSMRAAEPCPDCEIQIGHATALIVATQIDALKWAFGEPYPGASYCADDIEARIAELEASAEKGSGT